MHPSATSPSHGKRAAGRPIALLLALAVIALGNADHASAAKGVAKPLPAANVPKTQSGNQPGRAVVRPPSDPPAGTARQREQKNARQPSAQRGAKNNAIGRNGLPRRPLPGEAGFTGVPPPGESRF